MKRLCPTGGSIAAQNRYAANLDQLNPQRAVGRTSPMDFATPRMSNIGLVNLNLLSLISNYLGVPASNNANRATASLYEQHIYDFTDYGRDTLRRAFGIFDEAPTAFNVYLPTFVAYDFLNIQANIEEGVTEKGKYLRLAGMIRKILPTIDPDNFGKWEEYYRDFKNGKYSGGRNKWLARKAAETPYDPVDPVFNFTNPPTVKISGVNQSAIDTTNALYYIDTMPPTRTTINSGLTNIIKGGRSRRAARSSRRRY